MHVLLSNHGLQQYKRKLNDLSLKSILLGEHFLQRFESCTERSMMQTDNTAHQSASVHRAQLIKDDVILLPLETAGNPEWVAMSARGHCPVRVVTQLRLPTQSEGIRRHRTVFRVWERFIGAKRAVLEDTFKPSGPGCNGPSHGQVVRSVSTMPCFIRVQSLN